MKPDDKCKPLANPERENMKKIIPVLLMMTLMGCSGQKGPETYACVITINGKEKLIATDMHKWKCELHGQNVVFALESEQQRSHDRTLPEAIATYQCIPSRQFNNRAEK